MPNSLSDISLSDVISSVLPHLTSSDPLLNQFSQQFLNAVPSRSVLSQDPRFLASFLENRYAFFKKSVEKGLKNCQLKISNLESKNTYHKSLDIVCPDANYIIITMEALFKEFGIPITKLFHPIFSVELSKNTLRSVKQASVNTLLVSVIYFEFEFNGTSADLAAFEERISFHLEAIQHAFQSQATMGAKLEAIKPLLEKGALIPPPVEEWTDVFNAHAPSTRVFLSEPLEEWINLLDWLKASNFSFYGYGECIHEKGKMTLKNGLGILSDSFLALDTSGIKQVLLDHTTKVAAQRESFQFDTIRVKSPLQRFENLMRLSLKIEVAKGKVVEYIFLGLLRRSSLFVKNIETPIIHLKMQHIFKTKHMLPGSYDYTEVIRIFTSIPKFELFRTSAENLLYMVEDLLSITNPNKVYCFSRSYAHRLSLLVVIPHALFSRPNISLISDRIKTLVPHLSMEVLEIRGDEKCRLHIHFETKEAHPETPNCQSLEIELRNLIKPWEESLKDTLNSVSLSKKYANAFPNHYKVIRNDQEAARDIRILESLDDNHKTALSLIPFQFPNSTLSGKASILSIYSRTKIDLINIMPILQYFGLHVFDEITTSVGPQKQPYGYIHSFRVVDEYGNKINEAAFEKPLENLFSRIFTEQASHDPLNRLILTANLDWRGIALLQTYRNYHLQLTSHYSKDKINGALLLYPNSSRLLVNYFTLKFDPSLTLSKDQRQAELEALEKEFLDTLQAVQDVSDDLVFRSLFNCLENTLRTNFYIPKTNGETFISIKVLSKGIKAMPKPVPYREIFVYDVGMEGIHLRFGPVARGGLRWSDRPDDFRTEVLSLVKTQQVKNVVIVPVGSKGGFVLKKKGLGKDELAAESVKQYQFFIKALLDITDNVTPGGETTHPAHVLCYDTEDPYLVVAADKGTANFSDIANDISESYSFWLGDAFASGGSVGYNHKKEAITARGAWECTKLHFKELGKDILKESITVAGIGDMSGDVFGNGMLLGKLIKLQAAFNHVHIFLDPNPNPETSWKERKRMFDLPRSSWTDYNTSLISKGGGIFERKAKEIQLSPEVKKMLDLKKDVLTGEELIKAILKMQVDLLWFGGIGTYIKSSEQTHLQVGDTSNDSVRIDANECHALVVTEGANLGVTQTARMDFDKRGGHLNSDAIDNSAGVNMSDYEVNIKILLQKMLAEKQLKSVKERNDLLEKATHQVSELVLENNRGQHALISMDVMRSSKNFQLFNTLIQTYVTQGIIDAKTENIPTSTELDMLAATKTSLSRPVLAVIQAYVKMEVYNQLVKDAPLLDHPYLSAMYHSYFPQVFLDKFGDKVDKHHLKHEILTTLLTNIIINQAGCTFYFQAQEITGQSIGKITQCYLILNEVLGLNALREAVYKEAPSLEDAYEALIKIEKNLQALVTDCLQSDIALDFDTVPETKSVFDLLLSQLSVKDHNHNLTHWVQKGFKQKTAQKLTLIGALNLVSDVLYLNLHAKLDTLASLKLIHGLNRLFHLDWLKQSLLQLDLNNKDDNELRNSSLSILEHKKHNLIQGVLKQGLGKLLKKNVEGSITKEINHALKLEYPHLFDAYFKKMHDLQHHSSAVTVTSLSVALNRLHL
jgi:glutamate dehydrogenase